MSAETKSEIKNQKSEVQRKLLYLFTRTPLHVGTGASVGAIDQPIQRERHTGFPIIPASSLKGTFADAWTGDFLLNKNGEQVRVLTKLEGEKTVIKDMKDSAWLFGSDDPNLAWAGAVQFSEARLLAFPVRSARGSFAWITCPLILRRAARDGVIRSDLVEHLKEPSDEQPLFMNGAQGKLAIDGSIVLEEYTFAHGGDLKELGSTLQHLLPEDDVWREVASRLVVLSDGMMSFFGQTACEVAQHVRISDATGTAVGGALFNQENVPSETMFYSVVHCFEERTAEKKKGERRSAVAAFKAFENKLISNGSVFQFGGDASTGLGYCTVQLAKEKKENVQ